MITHEAQLKGAKVLRDRADQRAEFILHMVKMGYTTPQLATVFHIHESSVRTVLHRARKRLARRAAEAPLTTAQQPGEYYVDPDARDAYKPNEDCCTYHRGGLCLHGSCCSECPDARDAYNAS